MEVLSMAKKIFSVILALALVFSLSPGVFAATGNPDGTLVVPGTGGTVYVDTEIYSVVLPTSANLNFTLDPLGLLGIGNGSSAALAGLDGGKIVSNGIAGALNKSSVDIELTVGFKITGNATVVAAANIEDDTANNVSISVRPSKTNVDDSKLPTLLKLGDSVTGATLAEGAAGAFEIDSTGYALNFLLEGAAYVVKNTEGVYSYIYDPDTSPNGNGTAITIEGLVNSKADWTDYVDGTKSVGLAAVFSFEKADPTSHTHLATATLKDGKADTPDDIFGLKKADTATVSVPSAPTYGFLGGTGVSDLNLSPGDPTFEQTVAFTYDKDDIAVTLLPFAFNGNDIAAIWTEGISPNWGNYDATATFTEESGGLSFGSAYNSAMTFNMYIVLDNGDSFKAVVTVTD
jgi:hypothetical protein